MKTPYSLSVHVSSEKTRIVNGSSLVEELCTSCIKHGNRIAFSSTEGNYTYEELLHAAQSFADATGAKGAGARLLLLLPNSWEFIVSTFGGMLAGQIVIAVEDSIRPEILTRILRESTPDTFVVDGRVLDRLADLFKPLVDRCAIYRVGDSVNFPDLPELRNSFDSNSKKESFAPVSENDPVTITYTSGSTGLPKGVIHTSRSWLNGINFTREALNLSVTSRFLISFPLHHAYSFRHLLAVLLSGSEVLIAKDFITGMRLLSQERPDGILLVPAAARILLQQFKEIALKNAFSLKIISVGTAFSSQELLDDLKSFFPEASIFLPYGLTEVRVGFLSHDLPRRITQVASGLELTVVDTKGVSCGRGMSGEIKVKGPGLMKGYYNESNEDFELYEKVGFLTGDMGYLNENEQVVLAGRIDDMLDAGGRKISPAEIEAAINSYPEIVESAVVNEAEDSGILTETLIAYIVCRGTPPATADLIKHLRTKLQPYKIPERFVPVDQLPKTTSGKIQRKKIRIF